MEQVKFAIVVPRIQLDLQLPDWERCARERAQWFMHRQECDRETRRGMAEASPPFSFMRASRTKSNSVYVNYNAGGKPRLAEYSFLNIRGNHSLVYEAAEGADAY
ncbi:hypothetical protein EDB83DRAFT_93105 [Lactarius deliciosus]|nr:hypothetical protein EDB83DRAFT_93105 [Lactarius deliciosus]